MPVSKTKLSRKVKIKYLRIRTHVVLTSTIMVALFIYDTQSINRYFSLFLIVILLTQLINIRSFNDCYISIYEENVYRLTGI